MKKIVILVIIAIICGMVSGLAGCNGASDYRRIQSDAVSTVQYTNSDGADYIIVNGYYTFDVIFSFIQNCFKDLSPKRKSKGVLEHYETLTFIDGKGSFTVKYSGNIIERKGVLFEIGCDLSGIKEVFETNLADTDTEFYNEAYGEIKNQNMDVFLPKQGDGPFPFMLLIHGGGWAAGNKENFYATCKDLTDNGIAAVTINYRLTGQGAKYNDMLDDITSALNYIVAEATKYCLLTDKTALMGGSAGAHLSLLYATKINSPIEVKFVISLSGPTDFSNADYLTTEISAIPLIEGATGESMDDKGVTPMSWKDASPITHIENGSPYIIIAHGIKDEIVPFSDAEKLAAALEGAQVPYSFIVFENSGHGLDRDPDKSLALRNRLFEAIDDYLR